MQAADVHTLAAGPTGLPVVSDWDVVRGYPFGTGTLPPLPERIDPDPVRALKGALRPALLRTPCVIAFSGGRDSSLLLALAADLAAREGLERPVAHTLRYPGDAASQESPWQHLVVDHLRAAGLPVTWTSQDVDDQIDVIGPLVGPVVRAHGGPTWPPFLGPTILLARQAAGGALVTGGFGDEVLGGHRASLLRAVLARRGRGLTRAEWRRAAAAAAPVPVRRRLLREHVDEPRWLCPALRREVIAHQHAAIGRPLRWDHSVRSVLAPRGVVMGGTTRARVAEQQGCALVEPLGAVDFVASYASYGGRWGGITRAAATSLLAGGLLPPEVVRRADKASFNRSHFGPVSRAFAQSWDGHGLPPDLVDAEALRAAWTAEVPPAPTAMLLQQAWLTTEDTARSERRAT